MNLLSQTDRLFRKAEKRTKEWKKLYQDQEIPDNQITELLKERLKEEWEVEMTRLKNEIIPRYFELKNILEEAKVIQRDNNESLAERHVFISLRPEENACKLSTFVYDVEKFFTKNLFENPEWVFEQTGKNAEEAGKGFHAHGIAKVKKYVQIKDIVRAYQFIPYNCILQIGRKDSRTKFITKQRDLDFCKNYIRGDKHCEEKEPAVIINKLWREKNKLKTIYQ